MNEVDSILADLKLSREALLQSVEKLTQREATRLEIYEGWTVKDVLAHIIGWDQRAVQNLDLLLTGRGDEIPPVDAQTYNQQMVEAWRDKPFGEVLFTVEAGHNQLLDALAAMGEVEIDTRRSRQSKTVTIRSYIIHMVLEHDAAHLEDIQIWRRQMDKKIDPVTLIESVQQNRADFMQALELLDEAELTRKGVVGKWSLKDVIGHLADWERILLQTAEHIYDPSQMAGMVHSTNIHEQNMMMAAQREMKPLAVELRYLRMMQADWDAFMAKLLPDDWRLRGPYPWSDEHGTIAEIVMMVADHYRDHLAEVQGHQAD